MKRKRDFYTLKTEKRPGAKLFTLLFSLLKPSVVVIHVS